MRGKKQQQRSVSLEEKHALSDLLLKQCCYHLGGSSPRPHQTNVIIRSANKLPQQIWKKKRDCSFENTKLSFQIK